MRKVRLTLVVLALLLALSACAANTGPPATEAGVDSAPDTPKAATDKAAGDSAPEAPEARHAVPDTSPDGSTTSAKGLYAYYAGEQSPQALPGVLTAGRWDDHANWDFFQEVLHRQDWQQYQSYWRYFPAQRQTVTVSADDRPVAGANVTAFARNGETLWRSVTDNHGTAYIFSALLGDRVTPSYVEIEYEGTTERRDLANGADTHVDLGPIPISNAQPALDLMLVMDTTGSMEDELDYLKTELEDVVGRVLQANNGLQIRTSVNFYRDQGDEYVTRNFDFTDNLEQSLQQMLEQTAADGGDYPEAVDQALYEAVNEHSWEAPTRLMLLVLDAPPHNRGDNYKLTNALIHAAAEGIRIIPIASSGVDEETEFLLRTLAAATGGQYVFLTDDSEVGNEHKEPTIPEYETEYLNDLLVDVINDYLRSYPTVRK